MIFFFFFALPEDLARPVTLGLAWVILDAWGPLILEPRDGAYMCTVITEVPPWRPGGHGQPLPLVKGGAIRPLVSL